MSENERQTFGAELPTTVSQLRELVAEQERRILALDEELAQTNQGVVALYSELDVQAEELRRATELKSRFLSYMSHEFRTPLGSISSLTRILLDRMDGDLGTEQERQIRFIDEAARELMEMVDDLLDLAKIEAGRLDVSADWFEMVDLFSTLRGTFGPLLQSHDVALIFEPPEGLPKIFTDDRKLEHILRNFISNAIKFTQRGEIRVSAMLDGDGERITFAVRDTGIGIPAEYLNALFHDFVQVDSPIQKRLRGSGLGLSLSKRLAELLGGSVDVQSELGVGSTFFVSIPAYMNEEAERA